MNAYKSFNRYRIKIIDAHTINLNIFKSVNLPYWCGSNSAILNLRQSRISLGIDYIYTAFLLCVFFDVFSDWKSTIVIKI